MKILSQIYIGDNKFLLSLLGDTSDLSNLPTEYAADDSRFLNTDSNAVYVYTSADGWEITEAGQMKDLPIVSATDNGKILKVANGVWSIGTDESGGSLPANFPTEGVANANKFLGFDENGDYTAKEGGSSGGQFVVTFDDVDFEHGTIGSADKTYAQVLAAVAAGQTVVASLSGTGFLIPVAQAINGAPIKFSNATYSGTELLAIVTLASDESTGFSIRPLTSVSLLVNELTVLQNNLAPLIVNLTMDTSGTNPVLVGDKTFGDILAAKSNGKRVMLKLDNTSDDGTLFCMDVINASFDDADSEYHVMFCLGNALTEAESAAGNDYFRYEMD